ncbi:hypothetical protein L798_03532 [Zootermopsis nevadensis]|uniref:Uncharacterized protein n=1 Tax=Zootermopsis nevadensis TaxID=136037 RepID=A0A067QTF5_ZOONE|nr:hypothetical protein L798_03532 [Zootermopsis nevadensis]
MTTITVQVNSFSFSPVSISNKGLALNKELLSSRGRRRDHDNEFL